MTQEEFEAILEICCSKLTAEALQTGFASAEQFEIRVRQVIGENVLPKGVKIDFSPKAQAFPDIAVGDFGVEVKFTLNDTWRSVANSVLESSRSKHKHDKVVLYLLTQHGVLCHQVRDLFTAGSVTKNTGKIEVGLKLIEEDIRKAALEMSDALFIEYWGKSVPPEKRIPHWLKLADKMATGWKPSKCLFQK